MASGKQHFNYTIGLGAALTIGTLFVNPTLALTTVYYTVIALFVHPDCDLEATSYSERMIQQWTNKVVPYSISHFLMKLYQIIWYIYAIFTVHRGWTSHFPLIGTAGRVLYIYAILYFIDLHYPFLDTIIYSPELYWGLAVLAISDCLHFIMDGGMFIFLGKKRYGLGKAFYLKMRTYFKSDV